MIVTLRGKRGRRARPDCALNEVHRRARARAAYQPTQLIPYTQNVSGRLNGNGAKGLVILLPYHFKVGSSDSSYSNNRVYFTHLLMLYDIMDTDSEE